MAGHSKWAKTKRYKAAQDAKRGKLFSLIGKEITIAAKLGGGDISFNARLRTAVNTAKASNMPAENIERAIKKGTGELPGQSIEEVIYEGYAPGGVGVIIEVTTDNKNRSVSEIRSLFTKAGGNLAGAGALAFNFAKRGQFLIGADKVKEDRLMEVVLEAGAEDVVNHEDHFEVLTSIQDYYKVEDALQRSGISADSSALAYIPNNLVAVTDAEVAKKVMKLLDALEELDDVKSVYDNSDIEEKLRESLEAE